MIAWGGAAFAQSLSRLRLVDEYRFILQPVALGEGYPLFMGLTPPLPLELVDAQTYNNGARRWTSTALQPELLNVTTYAVLSALD
jgi:dihydrofolate reductase